MHKESGFTLAELFIAIVMLAAAGLLVYSQWQEAEVQQRDSDRKVAVNAIHAYLENIYAPQNDGYPVALDPEAIEALSPDQLRDPSGRLVTDFASDLRYEPGQCSEMVCQRFTIRANLEKEADFIRQGEVN